MKKQKEQKTSFKSGQLPLSASSTDSTGECVAASVSSRSDSASSRSSNQKEKKKKRKGKGKRSNVQLMKSLSPL
jgi:hypothetical protein